MAPRDPTDFFRDSRQDLVANGSTGIHVSNIRTALRMLGYDVAHGDKFDDIASDAVRDFQRNNKHSSVDGKIGPGTRKLLAQRLYQEFGDTGFGHLRDPSTMRIERDRQFQQLSSLLEDTEVRILEPHYSGPAARKVRIALRLLGYSVADSDQYDRELMAAVQRFQRDAGHRNLDGLIGPGTRRLLTAKLIDKFGDSALAQFGSAPITLRPYIFVSYKREDLDRISKYLDWITAWGHTVWNDQHIPGSVDWLAELEERLTSCILQLAFLSQAAVDSKWIQREIHFADGLNKSILPVWLEPTQLRGGLKLVLYRSQHLMISDPAFKDKLQDALQLSARKWP
jgi:peptidoglycan hydrolase-like protein with peptidoglycan-binding domain